ncbi:MAG: hypothetical protein L0H23_03895 [Luteimonas sp.]|nr:hypothetical protein [Luteimonas sp.]
MTHPEATRSHMMEHGALVELLLGGLFVCEVTYPEFYRQLQDDAVIEAVNDYLRPLNRRVVISADGSVAYLSWCHVTPELRDELGRHIGEVYRSLLPLLEWMLLVQEVLGRDGVVTAGDLLKQAEFVLRCEDNPGLRERLHKIARDRFFNSSADDVNQQVRQIFKRLLEHGYVVQPSSERQVFRVTGKINYLVELVRFLKDEENLPIDDDVAVQEELLP